MTEMWEMTGIRKNTGSKRRDDALCPHIISFIMDVL
jgi:hypothetical protein